MSSCSLDLLQLDGLALIRGCGEALQHWSLRSILRYQVRPSTASVPYLWFFLHVPFEFVVFASFFIVQLWLWRERTRSDGNVDQTQANARYRIIGLADGSRPDISADSSLDDEETMEIKPLDEPEK